MIHMLWSLIAVVWQNERTQLLCMRHTWHRWTDIICESLWPHQTIKSNSLNETNEMNFCIQMVGSKPVSSLKNDLELIFWENGKECFFFCANFLSETTSMTIGFSFYSILQKNLLSHICQSWILGIEMKMTTTKKRINICRVLFLHLK